MIENFSHIIESMIFASDEPLTIEAINETIKNIHKEESDNNFTEEIEKSIKELNDFYEQNGCAFRIIKIAGGYQFATTKDFSRYVGYINAERNRKRLSQAALETLAIIAYRQPITKPEIEKIRGVGADYILNTLLEKNLICIKGRAETVGRPLLYGTTTEFLNYFGINDLKDLPKPRELEEIMKDEEFQEQKRKLLLNALEEDMEKEDLFTNEEKSETNEDVSEIDEISNETNESN